MKHQIEKIFQMIYQKLHLKFVVMKNIYVLIGKLNFDLIHLNKYFFFISNYCTGKKYLLQRHLKSHSTERPHKCIFKRINSQLIKLLLLGTYCSNTFKTTAQLQNHVNTHLGIKPFQVKELFNFFFLLIDIFSVNFVNINLQQVENSSVMFVISKRILFENFYIEFIFC